MAKLKKAEKLALAKAEGLKAMGLPMTAEQVDGYKFAIPVEVEGEERWVEVTLVAKNDDYDPFVVQSEWKADVEAKRIEAETKAKAKADKEKARKSKKAKAE